MNKSIAFLVAIMATNCMAFNPDPCPGEAVCGNGCMPVGNVCCGDGESCPGNYVCGPASTCVTNVVSTGISTVESCVAQGEEPCSNVDGTIDCAPFGSQCCGNHTHCNTGVCCASGCCF